MTFTEGRLFFSLTVTSMISCSVAVDPSQQIRGSIIDIINIQRCCKEMKPRSEAYRWLKSMDQMGSGLSSGLEGRA